MRQHQEIPCPLIVSSHANLVRVSTVATKIFPKAVYSGGAEKPGKPHYAQVLNQGTSQKP